MFAYYLELKRYLFTFSLISSRNLNDKGTLEYCQGSAHIPYIYHRKEDSSTCNSVRIQQSEVDLSATCCNHHLTVKRCSSLPGLYVKMNFLKFLISLSITFRSSPLGSGQITRLQWNWYVGICINKVWAIRRFNLNSHG